MAATMTAGTWSSFGSANGSAQQLLRIGVAYISPPAEVGWTKQHSLAVEAIRAEFGDRVEIVAVDNVFEPQHAGLVFRDLAANGFDLVFGTSFVHGQPMQTVAGEFPAVAFENCAPGITLKNLGTFEARYYEGAFVAGVAAGSMTRTSRIGFVSPFSIPDFVSAANAFLLGARSVNPEAVCEAVFLQSWFSPEEERAAVGRLIAQDCDVICPMTDSVGGVEAAEELGAWTIGYASDMVKFAPERHLTAFTLDWSSVYLSAARAVGVGSAPMGRGTVDFRAYLAQPMKDMVSVSPPPRKERAVPDEKYKDFLHRENIRAFEKQLAAETNSEKRGQLIRLLAEEKARKPSPPGAATKQEPRDGRSPH